MRTRGNARAVFLGTTATMIVALAGGQDLKADGIITADPSLPPVGAIGGVAAYLTPADVHPTYSAPELDVVLSSVQSFDFTNIQRETEGADEVDTFQSRLTGLVSVNGSQTIPFFLSGPMSVIVFGKAGMETGTFQTAILSMDLTGALPGIQVEIRESPTLASVGQTTIADIGDGLFRIDSFFDVFTELSIDGGQTFIPSTGSSQVVLQTIPEPATWVMYLSAAGLMLPMYARWARRRT
jgi:hypothetical protein